MGQESMLDGGFPARRRLRDDGSDSAPDVTVVTTAVQLQAAVVSGAEHIEIRQHLDLTTLPILESNCRRPIEQDDAILGAVPPSVKSIRGKCTTAPAGGTFGLDAAVPLLPLLQQQCLLVTDGDVMQVLGDLWLDGLYLRMRSTGEQRRGGGGGIVGLQALGNVHAAECTFANLGGGANAVEVMAPGAAAFSSCSFRENVIAASDAAVITARAADARLEGCTFAGNSGEGHLLMVGAAEGHSTQQARAGNAFYSDEPRKVCLEVALESCARLGDAPGCVAEVVSPVPTAPASQWPPADPVLSPDDPWFEGTRKDVSTIFRSGGGRSAQRENSMGDCTPAGPPASPSGLGCVGTIIVIAAAVAAVAAITAAATMYFLRRRRRTPPRGLHEQGKQVQASSVLHVHL
eukprot:jgi/Ulvmu1/2850/UM145_0005.1